MTTNTNAAQVATLADLMAQAQVYASAYSLVGSRFDQGGELENAEEQKAELRKMIEAAISTAAQPPAGWVMVPIELAERVQETMGEFLMDHGWRQVDMDTSDEFGALLAAAPKAAKAAKAAKAELFTYLRTELEAIPCRYQGSPSYDHDAYWMRDRVHKLITEAEGAFSAPHRAAPTQPDFSNAYEGAREDLAIWKRRALEAERSLRAEREASSRLVAEVNAANGPTHLGEPVQPERVPLPDIGDIVRVLMHTARQDALNWEGRLALGRAIAILQAVQAQGIQPAHKEQR